MKIKKPKGIYLNVYQFACYISLLIVALPVVDYFCSWYITLLPFLLITYRLFKYKRTFTAVCYSMLLAIGFVMLQYWGVYRNEEFFEWMVDGIIVWLPCITALYIKENSNEKFVKNYLQMYIIMTTITSVTTIIGLIMYPNASRELASGTAVYDTTKYTIRNIGGYQHVYALVVLLPILMWFIKRAEKAWKIVNIVALLINLYCIYRSQYTIAIIIAAIIVVPTMLKRFKKIMIVTMILLGTIFFFNPSGIMERLSSGFKYVSEHIGMEYVGDRLLQVSQLLDGAVIHTETSAQRIDHYRHCLEKFSESPIIGNNIGRFSEENISGHSMILDTMSGMGILGILLVFAIFIITYRLVIKVNGKKINSTILLTWLAFIAVSILNPSSFMTIYMILFVLAVCVQRMEKKDEDSVAV